MSAARLAIPEFPQVLFFVGLTTLMKMDEQWIISG
jgi:hypothetical protein